MIIKNIVQRGPVASSTLQLSSIGKRIVRVSIFLAAWELLKSELEDGDWLAQAGALSEADIACIRQLRDYRREISDSLPKFLIGSNDSLDLRRVAQLTRLLKRLNNHATERLASSRP